ncbi:type II toxin-antitoxin system RelE/ParE family toxin [Dolichospermum sp. ST_sed3]|nr:type II toxin-antitoxin system RelE/ParE family toxin [Dolichospermum sp. ST_sed3]
MKIKFREKFEKDIESIINQDVLEDIVLVIENVEKANKPLEIDNIKKLKGSNSAFRIKIKKYRIGIYIIKDVVEFTRVLPRDKIYSYFPE